VNAIIALGSNLGDRIDNLNKAFEMIEQRIGKITKRGIVLETEPVGMESESKFLNTCIETQTNLSASALLTELKKIEIDIGRPIDSKGKSLPRSIDLDIIFYDKLIISTSELTIPHSKYHLRDFVLEPLLSLQPNLFDPQKKTYDKTVNKLKKNI